MQLSGTKTAPVIQNVFLSNTVQGEYDFVTRLNTLFVNFAPSAGYPYGGSRSEIRYEFNSATGMRHSVFLNRPAERAAAQAVHDAIVASGLLQQDLPANDWKRPATGRTRLYFDRRAHFLEYESGRPPAIAQPILDALAAYQRIAK